MANEVATKKQDAVTAFCSAFEDSVSQALPTHLTKEHFIRALQTSCRKTPRLLECTKQSIGAAVLMSAQLGLLPDVNGQCYFLPFKNKGQYECQLIIGYQGLVDLCYRSDLVESVRADVVCENDEFDFEDGLKPQLKHKRNLKEPRGEPYAVYAIASIKGSDKPVYVVLGRDEVLAVKASSRGGASEYSPWNGAFEGEMWKKTAIRRLCKLLPKSTEIISALDFENKQEERAREVEVKAETIDPLSPGRHVTQKKQKQVESQDTAATEPNDSDIYWLKTACENSSKAAAVVANELNKFDKDDVSQLPADAIKLLRAAVAQATKDE